MGSLDDLEADLAALRDKAGLARFDRSKMAYGSWRLKRADRACQSMPQCSRSDQRGTRAAETCRIACRAQQCRTVCACSACRNRQVATVQIGRPPFEPPGSRSVAFFQAADRAAEGDRIGLMMPRLDSFALAASQGGAKTPLIAT